jgi:hypothetical protein
MKVEAEICVSYYERPGRYLSYIPNNVPCEITSFKVWYAQLLVLRRE